MKRKKLLALGMAVVMSIGVMTGCGGTTAAVGDSGAESTAASGAEKSDAGEASESSDNTLVVGLTQSSMVTDYEDNYFTKYLEDKLGINIEFYMLPSDAGETRTKVNLLATSTEELIQGDHSSSCSFLRRRSLERIF
ncbi:MAG: hypothetical protein K5931_00185 [Lachnospiraceae bacterium]|nr:hypothetical protein [Lachnospiraceae bacterium]